jgi:hypothetical protein
MHPQQRCRCIWALAAVGHNPGRSWLVDFAAATFTREAAAKMQPGDLSDALWALYSLEQLDNNQQGSSAAGSGATAAAAAASPDQQEDVSSSLLTVQLMQLLGKKLDRHVVELQAQQILRLLLLAEGALDVVPSYSLPKGVADQLSQVLSARAAIVAESTGVIGLVWASARLGLRLHIMTLDQFCKRMYAQLESMSAADMARGFWASEKLGYR